MSTGDFAEAARRNMRELLLANGEAAIDRLTALRSIFEETGADFGRSLEELFGAPSSLIVDEILAARIGDAFPDFEACEIVATYQLYELESSIVIAVDRGFIVAMIEVMFGSNGSSPAFHEDRRITHIEARVGQSTIDLLKDALKRAFSPIVDATFHLESIENKFDLSALGRKTSVSIICAYRVRAFGNDGLALIAVPRSALDPFRGALRGNSPAEASAKDQRWVNGIRERVLLTQVTVRASMEKRGLTLGDVARFRVGQVIGLPFSPSSLIRLECEDKGLFWCALGQKDGSYSVRIEDFIVAQDEFVRTILNN
jgi:flagellar motor switch protein FliM